MVRNYIIKKEVRKARIVRIIGRCLCWPSRTLPELPQNVFKDTYPPEKRSGCWFNHSSQSAYELRLIVSRQGKIGGVATATSTSIIVNSNDKSISGALLYHILTCTHLVWSNLWIFDDFCDLPKPLIGQDLVCRTLQSFQWLKIVRSSSWFILVVGFDSWTMVSLQLINWVQHPKIELNRAKKYYFETAEPKSPSDSTGAAQQANCRELTCSRGCGRTDGPMPTWQRPEADSLGIVTYHHLPIFLEYS